MATLPPQSSAQVVLGTLPGRLSAATGAADGAGLTADEKAKKTAVDFEAVFLTAMFKEMFSGVKTDGPFGGGYAEEVFRDMLSGEYAKNIAGAGGVGLADQVYREILELQEIES